MVESHIKTFIVTSVYWWPWNRTMWFEKCKHRSAASFCPKVAARVPDMFCDLFLSEISQKMLTTQQPLKLEKKYIFFRILEIFGCMFDNVLKIKFYSIKFVSIFLWLSRFILYEASQHPNCLEDAKHFHSFDLVLLLSRCLALSHICWPRARF